MKQANIQTWLCTLALLGAAFSGGVARADGEDGAGESANFESFMGAEVADMDMLEPACMNCGTMMVTASSPGLKAGGDAAPSVASMEDETTLEFMAVRPDGVSGGPDLVVTSVDGEAEGLDTSVTTEMTMTKALPGRLMMRHKLKLKVKPSKRAKLFPAPGPSVVQCDPTKPYNKNQKGWQRLRIASAFKTAKGRVALTKAKPVMVCVRTNSAPPATCTSLSCGQGKCDYEKKGDSWVPFCDCKPGYAFSAGTCTDINECTAGATCPKGTTCENKPGSFACGCADGQVLTPAGCKVPPPVACPGGVCTGGKVCTRTLTRTSCQCPPNSVIVGGVCQTKRACAIDGCGNAKGVKCLDADTKPAPVPAIAPGEYQCSCPRGTVYKAGAVAGKGGCVDIDECKLANVKSYCGTAVCRNLDLVSPSPKADGAVCGNKKLPPAPSVSSMWSAGTTSWE